MKYRTPKVRVDREELERAVALLAKLGRGEAVQHGEITRSYNELGEALLGLNEEAESN